MIPFAYFGINSSGVNLAINIAILVLVVIYLALVYWTYSDARRRIADSMLIGCATLASLIFPFIGVIVYMILRPPEFLEDVRERELEMQAAEARLHELNYRLCPHCDYEIDREMIRCPSCLRKLRERCVTCHKPLDQAWTICPYCETEVAGAIQSARRTSRRRREPMPYDPMTPGVAAPGTPYDPMTPGVAAPGTPYDAGDALLAAERVPVEPPRAPLPRAPSPRRST
jgi:hypothetical protein